MFPLAGLYDFVANVKQRQTVRDLGCKNIHTQKDASDDWDSFVGEGVTDHCPPPHRLLHIHLYVTSSGLLFFIAFSQPFLIEGFTCFSGLEAFAQFFSTETSRLPYFLGPDGNAYLSSQLWTTVPLSSPNEPYDVAPTVTSSECCLVCYSRLQTFAAHWPHSGRPSCQIVADLSSC